MDGTQTKVEEHAALEKEARLKDLIAGYGQIALAYSGGVDSTYLADVAHEVLGPRARLVIADTPSIPRSELAAATALARERHWNLMVIHPKEFENEAFLRNERDRCYVCKAELFSHMKRYAVEQGIPVIAYGETADDAFDLSRYGKVAAQEYAVAAPLQSAGMKKDEIRFLSRRRGLPTWDKPSFACLSSRFPVGTRLTPAELSKVERAEEALKALGFRQYRARHHGSLCRLEVDPADFPRVLEPQLRARLLDELTAAGYRYVTLDLAGYRTGSTAEPPPPAESAES